MEETYSDALLAWLQTNGFSPLTLYLQSVANIPGEVSTQGEANRQTTAAMDVPHPAGDAHLPWHLDLKCSPHSRADPRPGGPPL